jgi:D-alanine-D-alanine ligase
MRIAIIYNRGSNNVINLFGIPNRERIGRRTIKRISDALRAGGHQVKAIEGDKALIDNLEKFMPRVLNGERLGLVFNVSYGIQGQARYTHVPSILEMVGIPYVASGPLAHALALDKVVAKMLFRQHGIPTPDFAVMDDRDDTGFGLDYPLIVKPKNEAVSFGLTVVEDERQLREAAGAIMDKFRQPVLVERFIEGREINVALIGNGPVEAFPPVELKFGDTGPSVYTYEDKTQRSGRDVEFECPADLTEEQNARAKDLAVKAFEILGCYDCARVDMRLDKEGSFYVLEVNSLPSLGEHGSYTIGAERAGLDFADLVNRLVDVAGARYFGTPRPPALDADRREPGSQIFSHLSERRDRIERHCQGWTNLHSRTSDPVGLSQAQKRLSETLLELGLKAVGDCTDDRVVWTWETAKGLSGGTLLVGHLDVPLDSGIPSQGFRRDPERLYGDGIGTSRAPLVMMEFALRALRALRKLRSTPLGVLYYTDEGRDGKYSRQIITAAMARAGRVLVLRPGNPPNKAITQRRGQRKYKLLAETDPKRLGRHPARPDALQWMCLKLDEISKLSSREGRVAVAAADIESSAFPMLQPHRAAATIRLSYSEPAAADKAENDMREFFGKDRVKWQLDLISDRPPLGSRKKNAQLFQCLAKVARQWDIPFAGESSLWPSVAGLAPPSAAVVCGLGPVAENLYTPQESVLRMGLLQRTVLLAEFLAVNP